MLAAQVIAADVQLGQCPNVPVVMNVRCGPGCVLGVTYFLMASAKATVPAMSVSQ